MTTPTSSCDSNFLSLSDAFFAKLQKLQMVRNLDFILDGSFADPDAHCQSHRWLPWVKTWDRNPIAALFSNSCAKNDSYCRFQVFDVPTASVPELTFAPYAKLKYGKFSRQNKYPLLVWEPSDQSVIEETANIYVSGAGKVPAGLRFAINISPERFSVFSAKYSGLGWNYRAPNSSGLSLARVFQIGNDDFGTVALLAWNESGSNACFQLLSFDKWFGNLTPQFDFRPLPSSAGALKSIVSAQLLNSSTVFICDFFSCIFYDFVRNVETRSLSSPPVNSKVIFCATVQNYSAHFTWLVATNDCNLQVGNFCIIPKNGTAVSSASATFISAQPCQIAIAFSSVNAELFFGIFDICESGAVNFVQFGVGNFPSISFNSNSDSILISASDSFCYNSEFMNKEIILFCSFSPKSTAGVLSYWFGPVKNWAKNLEIFSPCNKLFSSGCFDNGNFSQISLGNSGKIIEIHSGVVSDSQQCKSCGIAREFHGLIIDAFGHS